MCTALTIQSNDKNTFFGRTMDFSYELEPEVFIFPRDFEWIALNKYSVKNKYKFIGIGQKVPEVICSDGANEKGLVVAALYFSGFAKYDEESQNFNLPSVAVVNYILGNCQNLEEVKQLFRKTNIIGIPDQVTGIVSPLHWIVADKNGNSLTIEKTASGLHIYDNKIGVLTNSPTFDFHMTNLRNYLNLSPLQYDEANWNGLVLEAFGNGTRAKGLPGDYTSTSRFVKTCFQKSCLIPAGKKETLVSAFHLLETVSIPKGVVITSNGAPNYTQYIAFIDIDDLTYYVVTYENRNIQKYKIIETDKLLSLGKIRNLK